MTNDVLVGTIMVGRCIPKDTPGADWRVLLEIVKNDPSREKFNVSNLQQPLEFQLLGCFDATLEYASYYVTDISISRGAAMTNML